jgi:23S rRNA pseudouridine2605 synthase
MKKTEAHDTPAGNATSSDMANKGRSERLARRIARAGICSRREAERLIAAGRVAVNGMIVETPALNVTAEDEILVDGEPLPPPDPVRLWRYHKPRGLIVSERDEKGRPTIFDQLAQVLPPDAGRVISIGRLDLNSEGLLLLTNDGRLARELELPSRGWTRRYRVRAYGRASQAALDALREGITIDGVHYGRVIATLDRAEGANVWMTFALKEGKNREIRRICEHLGLKVNRLLRVSYGPFQLGALKKGEVAEVPRKQLAEQLGGLLAEVEGERN